MPLTIPKSDATQEEINAWIVSTQESYDKIEADLATKSAREITLLNENNKLFAKVTSKKEDKEDKEEEEIPLCLDEKTYKLLSKKDIEVLNELIEGDDE